MSEATRQPSESRNVNVIWSEDMSTLEQKALIPWKLAGIYGKVCSCGCRLPHDSNRIEKEMKTKNVVCFGPTHPALV